MTSLELTGSTAEVALALLRCAGWAVAKPDRPATAELVVDRQQVMVAIKHIEAGNMEAITRKAVWNVMIRVDLEVAGAKTPEQIKEVDRFIMRLEPSLNVLIVPWRQPAPFPFPPHGLAVQTGMQVDSDSWVQHIVTRGRYRMSLWWVVTVGGGLVTT